MKPKILITAANGNTGFPAAKEMLKLGFPVRAFVRNPNTLKARELKSLGAEIFVGDIQDIRDVRRALKDIQRAYFVPTYPNVLYQGVTFATAVEEAKTEHVVVMTQWLSSNTHPSIYTKEHWLVDQTFKRITTTKVTFINPGLFGFIYFMTPEPLVQFGMLPNFGDNAPPSNEDIGLVAAHILKAPEAHVDKAYRISGREVLSSDQMASVIEKVIGRKVKATMLPEKMISKVLKASGVSKMDSSQILYYIKEGYKGTWAINAPTSVVKDFVGKEADDFETIVRRYLISQPITKQTLANKIKAILFMIKVMLLPTWDMERFEKERDFPKFQNMMFSSDSNEWRKEHNASKLEEV
ncbi:MAG: NmrA family NAD(P)-binding protein [Candidatus Scalindua sp.]